MCGQIFLGKGKTSPTFDAQNPAVNWRRNRCQKNARCDSNFCCRWMRLVAANAFWSQKMVRAFPSFPLDQSEISQKINAAVVRAWVGAPPLSGISFFGSNKKSDTDEEQRERGEETWKTGACCIFVFSTGCPSAPSLRGNTLSNQPARLLNRVFHS